MKPPRILRCAIYTRKSTEEGLEQAFNSLDAQREACDAYIKSQTHEGWIALSALYDDGGFSGGNMERPALVRLLADIDRGLVDVVVVYKVDRLTRALADFAKIVERFDKRGVCFVSVTQAFNTTSSMGRLTLNVLLSFAQFEREVTSERIRDKLAASRRKGMWMGGKAPFGYVVREKKIFPDEIEAPLVRRIYTRYLELGSVRLLRDELKVEGVISKPYISRHGRAYGGKAFDRGALYHLLQNRIYIGEIRHKEERHKGKHDGIVPMELFDSVQAQLATARRRELGEARTSIHHPLVGLIWDGDGNRMSPTHGQKGGKRYRYYVSRTLIDRKSGSKTGLRITAATIEALVRDRLDLIAGSDGMQDTPAINAPSAPDLHRTILERVVVCHDAVTISLRRDQLEVVLQQASKSGLSSRLTIDDLQQRLDFDDRIIERDDHFDLLVAIRLAQRGSAAQIELPSGESRLRKPKHDPALLKAIARAHVWLELVLSGKADTLKAVAERAGVQECYVRQIMPLAFLSPADLARVLDGRQPHHLTVDAVARDGVTAAWRHQLQ